MNRRNESKMVKLVVALSIGAMAFVAKSEGQAVPIPFAQAPVIGNGATATTATTYCAGNIPIYYKPNAGYVQQNEGDGCPASGLTMGSPGGVAVDSYGNVFFTDQQHYTVRVVYEGGTAVANAIVAANVMNFIGGNPLTPVTAASLVKGNVYLLAGSYSSATVLGTEVGPTTPYYCNQAATGAIPVPNSAPLAGCPGGYAYLAPESMAIDSDGNPFFTTQTGRHAVMVLYIQGTKAAKLIQAASPGLITTVTPGYMYIVAGTNDGTTAGSLGVYIPDGPLATNISMYQPRGMYIDQSENVYYADQENNLVRKVNGTTDAVTTLAGVCTLPSQDTAIPYVYPCESAQQLGLTTPAAQGDGGPATSAHFNYVYAVTFDANGNMFIADSGANQNSTTTTPATPAGVIPGRVRVVYAGGTLPGISSPQVGYIYTYAGGGTSVATNTPALNVNFDEVEGLSIDSSGYLYVTDHRKASTTSNRIWRIDPVTGIATIIVGVPSAGLATATLPTTVNCNTNLTTVGLGPTHNDKFGTGCPAAQTPVNGPIGSFAFDKFGNAYLADSGYALLHKYSFQNIFPSTTAGATSTAQYVAFDVPVGTVTTGLSFGVEGTTDAEYSDVGVTTDTCTAVMTFAVDTICSYDLKFSPAKVGMRYGTIQLTTATGPTGSQFLSGIGQAGVLTIDPGTQGTLGTGITPSGIAVDQLGNAYMSDSKGNQVLKIPTGGGTATAYVMGLSSPSQVAVDGQGTIYVADTGNNRIVRKPITGATTYLGTGLKGPKGVAVDFDGNVYVADTGNSRVVELGAVTGIQTTLYVSAATLSGPSYLSIDANGNLFIVDATAKDIVELPMSGGQQLVSVTGVATPVAVVADLAGNLFVLDSTTEQVYELLAGATSPVVSLTGLGAAVGMAIDTSGEVYVADPGTVAAPQTTILTLNRTNATAVYPQTDIKQPGTAPLAFLLSSSGTNPLTLGNPLDTNTNATVFPIVASSTNGCTASEALALGADCGVTGTFYPTVTGQQMATVTFASSGNSVTINESGKAVNLTLTTVMLTAAPASPITIGTTDVVTATVGPAGSPAETGTVTFSVDGVTQKPAQALPGTISITLTGLAIGSHTVQACYSGDTVYSSSCGSTTIVVTKIATTLTETVTQGNGGPTVTATITPTAANGFTATGTISFTLDGGAAGPAKALTAATDGPLVLTNGTHQVCATYTGDANYATSTNCTTLTISLIATTLSEAETPGLSGPTVAATLAVTGSTTLIPTGTITFVTDGVGAGTVVGLTGGTTAAIGPLNLQDGPHTIVATYSGDGNFATSKASVKFTIQKVGVNFTLAMTTITGGIQFQIVFNSLAQFTGNGIAYAPTGSFSITLSGTLVKTNTLVPTASTSANGTPIYTYTYTSSALTATGTDSPTAPVVATYSGDGNYETGTAINTTVAVYHEPTATTLTVVRGAGGSVVSGTITPTAGAYPDLQGSVSGFVPLVSGTVTILRDGLTDGTITLTSANPAAYSFVDSTAADGNHTFTATYNGDGNYHSSTSTTGSITVLHAPTTTTLVTGGGGNAGVPGIALTSTTTSTTAGVIAGTAAFYNNGTLIGTYPVVNGVAAFVTPSLVYPTYTFCVTYQGDGNYLPSPQVCATEGVDLAIAPTTPTTFSVPFQSQQLMTFNLASINGYGGTLTPSCTGLPVNVICRFDNYSLPVGPNTQATSNLLIYSSINPNTASVAKGYSAVQLASTFGAFGFAMLLWMRRRGLRGRIPMLLCGLLLLGLAMGVSGCGNGISQYTPTYITPAGTDNISVTYTDATGFSRSVVLTLTFLPQP